MTKTVLGAIENDSSRKNFYPTPDALAEKLLNDVDWYTVRCVLEPSAGDGALAQYVANKLFIRNNHYSPRTPKDAAAAKETDIDCVEIDSYLRGQLEDKGFRVIYNDFLTFETQKRYDLIVMNPPFDRGAEHLLHALELIRHGGEVRCVLNAETVRNAYSAERKRLLQVLGDDASITFVKDGFLRAERKTDVEVALIVKRIARREPDSTIVEDMRKAPTYKVAATPPECADMVRYNQIDEFVNSYNFEVACGIKLIEEYHALQKFMEGNKGMTAGESFIELKLHAASGKSYAADINAYIRQMRGKYWRAIFQQKTFTSRLTSNLLEELQDAVRELMDYDFSAYNILTLLIKMGAKVTKGVEDTILELFDSWTRRTWHEESPNRHYYDGWKTNDCFAVGKKVIIPFYNAFSSWDGRFTAWRVQSQFADIEKVFDYLDNGRTDWDISLSSIFDRAEKEMITRNIDTKYFTVTFYKKGTAHLVFKDMKLLEKFNMYAGRRKGWLPPCYGKKRYTDMTAEEQHIVDSFQGKERYEKVLAQADYYLDAGSSQMLMLGAGK